MDNYDQPEALEVPLTPYDAKNAQDPDSDQKLLSLAKKRFQMCTESESENRKEELEDLKFMVGDQWPIDIRHQRQEDQRPCLTVNLIPKFIRQIANDQRQNRPAIKVNPADNRGDIETAKVLEGMIRHIEYNSHADIAYDMAFEGACSNGRGYFRVLTEYVDPFSFQQEIVIKAIKDPMSVYLDPFYREPDGCDAQFGFIFCDISKDEFRSEYPTAALSLMSDWASIGDNNGLYIKKDMVRVAEYFYKVWERKRIVLCSDQKTYLEEDLPKPDEENGGLKDYRIISRRETIIPKIKWAKLNGLEVLERADCHGHWIPIIPVIGNDHIVDGKRIVSGIIRDVKDAQRMYNFWNSAQTEMIALAPRAPFIVAEGQIEDYEEVWKTSNTKNHSVLTYKPTSNQGTPVPPPIRTPFEPQVQAITISKQQSAQDINAVTGIYDDNLGQRSNAETGVAIQRRITQGNTANFHYVDNLARSLRHTGRILINWIPAVYKDSQAVRILGENGEVKFVDIHKLLIGQAEGIRGHFLDEGRYDCTVSTGPSYQTRRQEAVASMLDLARSVPQTMQGAMDILVGNMDWPGAQMVADRIKKMLPPQLTQDEQLDMSGLPPQVRTQLGQMANTIQNQNNLIQQQHNLITTKKMEIESKERIELLKQQTDLAIEYMKHHQDDAKTAFLAEVDLIKNRLNMIGENVPIGMDSGLGPQQPGPSAMPQSPQNMPTGGQPSPGQPMGGNP